MTSFFEIKGAFLRFSRKRQDEFAPKFFSRFRTKHLFITTCIEKQCTRPLMQSLQSVLLWKQLKLLLSKISTFYT